ncbi:MAG: RelA/SpoT domain-containing protein [Candidatus Hydrogenedentes bacterium]|nr:RelA/SpoT domain-containing protein [Candidatus Hydrogenedentota bacterium]
MERGEIPKGQRETIEGLVEHFQAHEEILDRFLEALRENITESHELMGCVHSLKWRVKDPNHLRDKLERKAVDAQKNGAEFSITKDNLFEKVNDLAGIRILHLHTDQFPKIHEHLSELFEKERYPLCEKPFVRLWDDETESFFKPLGIEIQKSDSLYTSVHYVVRANPTARFTCEIQVRTLMEEVWGEVDHTINYPQQTESLACKEQIKTLAYLTKGCTRLVDSIFRSHEEFKGSDEPIK